MDDLNSIISQYIMIDIYRMLTSIYTAFKALNETISKIDHILGQKLSQYQ